MGPYISNTCTLRLKELKTSCCKMGTMKTTSPSTDVPVYIKRYRRKREVVKAAQLRKKDTKIRISIK